MVRGRMFTLRADARLSCAERQQEASCSLFHFGGSPAGNCRCDVSIFLACRMRLGRERLPRPAQQLWIGRLPLSIGRTNAKADLAGTLTISAAHPIPRFGRGAARVSAVQCRTAGPDPSRSFPASSSAHFLINQFWEVKVSRNGYFRSLLKQSIVRQIELSDYLS